MPTHIALLRGVNVGGHRRLPMADLRAMLGDLGLRNAATLLQSGNAVFDGGRRSAAALESLLERETAKRLGVETEYFVYDAATWRRIIAANPMREIAERDPSRFVVMFLRDAPSPAAVRTLHDGIPGDEVVRGSGRQLYVHYPAGQGVSRFAGPIIERRLGTGGTARNWNTVLKLAALTS